MTLKNVILFYLILFMMITTVYMISNKNNDNNEEIEVTDKIDHILNMLDNAEGKLKSRIKSIVETILPYMMRLGAEANISSPCRNTGTLFLNDLTDLKTWTIQMLDSFGKPSSGVFKLSMWFQGDYDQCLDLKITENINGKYCALKMKIPKLTSKTIKKIAEYKNNSLIRLLSIFCEPFEVEKFLNFMTTNKQPRFDICIPNTCSENDVENLASWIFSGIVNLKVYFCKEKGEKFEYSTAQLICMYTLGFFILWAITALLLEIILNQRIFHLKEGIFMRYVLMASPLKSLPKLFSISIKGNTKFICGMKFIIMIMFIYGHQIVFLVENNTIGERYSNIAYLEDKIYNSIVFQGTEVIESFFFISGFLLCYSRYNNGNNSIKYYVIFLIKRFIRLTVPIFITLAIQIIIPLCGDGPHWELLIGEGKFLEKNWWKFVLHIENFYNVKINIVNFIWFINVSMQLTVIAVPLLFIQDRWQRIGNIMISLLIVGGIVNHISAVFINEYHGVMGKSITYENFIKYINHHYSKPYYSHLSTYLFGMLIGSYIAKNNKIKLEKKTIVFSWIISTSLMLLSIFSIYNESIAVSPNENIFLLYQSLAPFGWTIGIAWISIACISGYGGIINSILSAKVFVILDNLNIWLYLLNYIVNGYVMAQERRAVAITNLNLYKSFSFIMVLTLILSTIVYLFFEYPINRIIMKIFNGISPVKYKEN